MLSRSARTAAAMAAPAARQSWSRLKTVLVAVDPSAGSRLAFDHASQLVTADDKLLLYTCGPATRPEIANFMLNMEKSDDATKKAFFEKLKARSEELASGVKRIYDPLLKTLSVRARAAPAGLAARAGSIPRARSASTSGSLATPRRALAAASCASARSATWTSACSARTATTAPSGGASLARWLIARRVPSRVGRFGSAPPPRVVSHAGWCWGPPRTPSPTACTATCCSSSPRREGHACGRLGTPGGAVAIRESVRTHTTPCLPNKPTIRSRPPV